MFWKILTAVVLATCCGHALAVDLPIVRGTLTAAEILDRFESYRANYTAYTPDAETLAAVGALPAELEVVVVFGSWCSDSLDHVPGFIKIIEALKLPADRIRYIGVDRTKRDPDGLTDDLHIERVPTFIFLLDGVEAGRIIETPNDTLEKAIRAILRPAN